MYHPLFNYDILSLMYSSIAVTVITFVSIALGITAAYPFRQLAIVSHAPQIPNMAASYTIERGILQSVDTNARTFVISVINPFDYSQTNLHVTHDERTDFFASGNAQVKSDVHVLDNVASGIPMRVILRNTAGALYTDQVILSPKLQPSI